MLIWRAVYSDNKYLPQFNDDGTENTYKEIDRYRLRRFDLLNEEKKVVYSCAIRPGQRLIYRRRNFIRMSGERWLVYLVGWQMTVNEAFIGTDGKSYTRPKNIVAINYFFPDGTMALDDSRDNLELLPEEM